MTYTKDFYCGNAAGSHHAGERILGDVIEKARPGSVVDFGCGAGYWLKVAVDNGITDVCGLDGEYVARSGTLVIDENCFVPSDLSGKVDLRRKFDLAISVEVAEHIPTEYAETFVDNLCRHSDVILFSAAIQGQGGMHHVNEKPLSYWCGLFLCQGYDLLDCLRGKYWHEKNLPYWYRQNIVLFVRHERVSHYFTIMGGTGGNIIDIVHPELLAEKTLAKMVCGLFSKMLYRIGLAMPIKKVCATVRRVCRKAFS